MKLNIDENVLSLFKDAWFFKIITVDGNPITVGSILIGVLFLIIGLITSKIISRLILKNITIKFSLERNINNILEKMAFYFLSIIAVLIAMKIANIPLTAFTVIGGALAIGVGFGSQNLVNNFMSGFILMVERPIKIGDFIEVDNLFGEVESIGGRSTVILTYGNRNIIVPNSSFLEKNVVNWTHNNQKVRSSIKVGVTYGSDVEKVRELLLHSLTLESKVINKSSSNIYFEDFGDDSLRFSLEFWIELISLNDRRVAESNLRFIINKLFIENNIVIAFPQRDIHLYANKAIPVNIQK
jgi:small-conductance mechanosensitive channel